MSAHHDEHHHHPHNDSQKSKSSFTASFWLVIILVGLFIAALNFIEVMSHDDEGHGAQATHEAIHAPEAAGHEGHGGTEATHAEGDHQEATGAAHGAPADTTHHEEAAHH